MIQSIIYIIRYHYLLVTLIVGGAYAFGVVFLYRTMGYSLLDNLLVFLIAPIFFAAIKFRARVYLKTAAVVGLIAYVSICFTSHRNHLASSLCTVSAIILSTVFYSEFIYRNLHSRRILLHDKQELIEKLEKALGDVKTLGGLLPICSSCKKIRDDKGYWNQLEEFFDEHSDMQFSHSFCPDCLKKLYPSYSTEEKQPVSHRRRD